MSEWNVVLKNTTGNALTIADLGWNMPNGTNTNVTAEFDFGELAGSQSLENAVTAGQVVVNDGTADLTAVAGNALLKRAHKKYVDDAISTVSGTTTTDITALQTELDTTQTGAGLSATGTYVADGSTNYINTATSLKDADKRLDAQVKINTDNVATNTANIATNAGAIAAEIVARGNADTNLQNELNATQVGAGLQADGTYLPITDSNYINSSVSIKNATLILDTAIKDVADDLAALGSGSLTTLQQEVDRIETATGLDSDGNYAANGAANYISAATDLKDADNKLDAQLKTTTTATATNATNIATNTSAIATNTNNIATNATNITTNANAIANEVTARGNADTAIQTELDAVETAVGLNANGTFNQHSGTNYINAATTVKAVDVLLDAQIKINADAIADLDSDATAGLALKVDKAGDSMTGNLDMGANEVFSTASPSSANAYTNKTYVDMMVQGITPKANVKAAATTPLPASTYNNGTGGFGATITASSVALPVIDGVTLSVGDSLVVVGQADAKQNGVYVVTTATAPFVLTRRTDMDGTPANEFAPGTTVPVNGGTAWSGYMFYIVGEANVNRIPGTDTIDFSYTPGSTATANVQGEVDAIEAASGLNADGSWNAHTTTNYLNATGNAKEAREALDTQVKTNADAIAVNTTNIATNTTNIAGNTSDIADIFTTLTDIKVIDGNVYGKDATRSKWIGTAQTFIYGLAKSVQNRYLKSVGDIVSNLTGTRVHRAMCITGMTVQLSEVAAGAATIEIRKNNTATVLASIAVNAVAGNHVNNLNVNLAAGDYMQVYVNGGKIENPIVTVIAAYTEAL